MHSTGETAAQADFIAAPRSPALRSLFAYWTAKRGTAAAPARADIRPAEIKPLLPDVMIWNVEEIGGPYTIRLVGERIVRFVGRNNTGVPATHGMTETAAAGMTAVLDDVVRARLPRFRIGKAYWLQEKSYRDFEACYLPLSSDGRTVDMILGGVTFDDRTARIAAAE
jgi:hypothetical protein